MILVTHLQESICARIFQIYFISGSCASDEVVLVARKVLIKDLRKFVKISSFRLIFPRDAGEFETGDSGWSFVDWMILL